MADSTELPKKQFFRPDEVADRFQVSVRTVYRMCDEGKLDTVRFNACVRIKRESIVKAEKDT